MLYWAWIPYSSTRKTFSTPSTRSATFYVLRPAGVGCLQSFRPTVIAKSGLDLRLGNVRYWSISNNILIDRMLQGWSISWQGSPPLMPIGIKTSNRRIKRVPYLIRYGFPDRIHSFNLVENRLMPA